MVAGEVNYFSILGKQSHDMLNYLHVCLGPIPFGKLPHVNDIAVQDYFLRLDGFEIAKKLFGMTAVSAQVDVG